MMSQTRFGRVLAAGLAFVLIAGCKATDAGDGLQQEAGPEGALSTFGTIVDANGAISLPDGYATDWPFIGTWSVVEDNGVPSIHNVFMREGDTQYFRETGKYRDGTVMVKEVRHGLGAQHTTGKAFWAGGVDVWFVMVKDTTGRFPGNANWGDGWGWALFKGDNPMKQVSEDYKTDCLGCHEPVRERDLIYAYGYPSFGEKATSDIPADTESFDPSIGHGGTAIDQARGKENAPKAMSDAELVMHGKELYASCAACHSTEAQKAGIGPSLFGVYGRKAGSLVGYSYSPAMKNSGVVWDKSNLDQHLSDVKGFIPDNKMAPLYPQGVPEKADREAIIAYLEQLK